MNKVQTVVGILRTIPQKNALYIKPSLLESVIQQIDDKFGLTAHTRT